MSQCTVCRSPLMTAANSMIVAGMQATVIATHTSLSEQALRRHRRAGHVPTASVAVTPTFIRPDGPVDVAADLTAQRDVLNAIDITTLSPSTQMALFAERRRTAEALSKVLPPPLPPSSGALEKLLEIVFGAIEGDVITTKTVTDAWREYRGLAPAPPRDLEAEAKYRR